jgi:hypothetical protein
MRADAALWSVAAAFATLPLGATPAQAAPPSRYDGYDQGAYLSYLNAPPSGGDLTRPPRLRISFGARSYGVVMDTGSTGIVVSADKIPNVDRLPSLGPGRLTYSSSGRIMIGRWVVTPVTIMGRNGASVATAPIPVLAVDRIECTEDARRCTPRAAPRGVSMLGIGFARRGDHQAQSGPTKNPFLNVAAVNGSKADHLRRGYLVTSGGVAVGLTAANTRGAFAYVKLARAGDDWAATPACISVNGAAPAACGTLLMDERHVPDGAREPSRGRASHDQRPLDIGGRHENRDLGSDRSVAAGALQLHAGRERQPAGAGAAQSRQPCAFAVRQYQRTFPQRLRLSLRCRRRLRRLAVDRPCRADHRQGRAVRAACSGLTPA